MGGERGWADRAFCYAPTRPFPAHYEYPAVGAPSCRVVGLGVPLKVLTAFPLRFLHPIHGFVDFCPARH